jgi:hypothetical protein
MAFQLFSPHKRAVLLALNDQDMDHVFDNTMIVPPAALGHDFSLAFTYSGFKGDEDTARMVEQHIDRDDRIEPGSTVITKLLDDPDLLKMRNRGLLITEVEDLNVAVMFTHANDKDEVIQAIQRRKRDRNRL